MKDQELDKIFQAKLSAREFPADAAAWAGAEKLIEAQEVGRGGWFRWWMELPVLLLLPVTVALWPQAGMQPKDGLAATATKVETVEATNLTTMSDATAEATGPSQASTAGVVETAPASVEAESTPNGSETARAAAPQGTPRTDGAMAAKAPPAASPAMNIKPDQATRNHIPGAIKTGQDPMDLGHDSDLLASAGNSVSLNSQKLIKSNYRPWHFLPTDQPFESLENTVKADRQIRPLDIRKFTFGLVGGIQAARGFQNNQGEGAGWTPGGLFGLRASYQVNNFVSLNTNLLMQTRGGLSSDYTFRSGVNQSTLQSPKQLVYLDLPFYLNLRLADAHSMLLGIQYSTLVYGYSRKTVNDEDASGSVLSSNGSTQWGKPEGFSTSDLGLMVGYEYALNYNVNIGFRAHFNQFDVTDDGFFRSSIRDKNLQLRLTLDYRLFK
ncbi:MAG: outer membrane beta-barrel protein [Bacteroidota bacterium]